MQSNPALSFAQVQEADTTSWDNSQVCGDLSQTSKQAGSRFVSRQPTLGVFYHASPANTFLGVWGVMATCMSECMRSGRRCGQTLSWPHAPTANAAVTARELLSRARASDTKRAGLAGKQAGWRRWIQGPRCADGEWRKTGGSKGLVGR